LTLSIVNGAVLSFFDRPSAEVHKDKRTQDNKKKNASHAVNFLRTSAVDVPNKESPDSPPKEAPKPVLLLSWIKMTKQRSTQSNKKSVKEKK
jgi:hypothetical protein